MSPFLALRKLSMGMRIIKTGFAVFICCLLAHIIGTSPLFAAIAAVISMKTTYEDSLKIGRNRVLGTLIGGLAGMSLLYVFASLNIESGRLLYDIISVGILMLLIKILDSIYQSGTIIITLVVFLSLLYLDIGADMTIFSYSALRVIETIVGVMVALVINRLFPYQEESESA